MTEGPLAGQVAGETSTRVHFCTLVDPETQPIAISAMQVGSRQLQGIMLCEILPVQVPRTAMWIQERLLIRDQENWRILLNLGTRSSAGERFLFFVSMDASPYSQLHFLCLGASGGSMHETVQVQLDAPPPPAAASPSSTATGIVKLGVMVYMSKVGEMHFPPVRRKNTCVVSGVHQCLLPFKPCLPHEHGRAFQARL